MPDITANANVFFFSESVYYSHRHSFPTRRSSDLPDLVTTITNTTANPQVGHPISYTRPDRNQGEFPAIDELAFPPRFSTACVMTKMKDSNRGDCQLAVEVSSDMLSDTHTAAYHVT